MIPLHLLLLHGSRACRAHFASAVLGDFRIPSATRVSRGRIRAQPGKQMSAVRRVTEQQAFGLKSARLRSRNAACQQRLEGRGRCVSTIHGLTLTRTKRAARRLRGCWKDPVKRCVVLDDIPATPSTSSRAHLQARVCAGRTLCMPRRSYFQRLRGSDNHEIAREVA